MVVALSFVVVAPLLVRLLAGPAHHWRVAWGGEQLVVRGWWGGKDVTISTPVHDVPAAEMCDRPRARVPRHPGGAR